MDITFNDSQRHLQHLFTNEIIPKYFVYVFSDQFSTSYDNILREGVVFHNDRRIFQNCL